MFTSMSYTAYCSNGEILECDNFKTIFHAARYRVRDDAQAAIICRNSDNKIITYILAPFNFYDVITPNKIHPNMLGFIKQIFIQQNEGWMLHAIGLE